MLSLLKQSRWFPLCFVKFIFHFVYLFFVYFCFVRCPAGQIQNGHDSPNRAECVYDTDCFGVNKCLNGGTCVASKTPWVTTRSSTCMCPPFFDGVRCEIVTDATYVLSGGKDFVIIIIFALAILLSKFCFRFKYDGNPTPLGKLKQSAAEKSWWPQVVGCQSLHDQPVHQAFQGNLKIVE